MKKIISSIFTSSTLILISIIYFFDWVKYKLGMKADLQDGLKLSLIFLCIFIVGNVLKWAFNNHKQ